VQLPVRSGEHPQVRGGERAPVEAVQLHWLLAHRLVDVTAASLPADGAPAAAFRARRRALAGMPGRCPPACRGGRGKSLLRPGAQRGGWPMMPGQRTRRCRGIA
jgi:hypothetical protein